jgi:uncharacterized membrane protein
MTLAALGAGFSKRPIAMLAAASVAGFVVGGAVGRDGFLFGPTVAAWVQAIGSIIAIVAGFRVAAWQHARLAEAEQSRRKEIKGAAHVVCRVVADEVLRLNKRFAGNNDSATFEVGDLLREFPLYTRAIDHYLNRELPDPEIVGELIDSLGVSERLTSALEAYAAARNGGSFARLWEEAASNRDWAAQLIKGGALS